MPSPHLTPPLQSRSRRSLEKLVAAGEALLLTGGPDAVTVVAVTKRARVSVGSFYARFQGKEDFLRYLGEGSLEAASGFWTAAREWARATPATSARDRVERLVLPLAQLFLDGPGAALVRLDGVDDPSPTRVSRLEAFLAAEVRRSFRATETRATLAVRTAAGLLREWARESTPQASENETAPPSEEDGAAPSSVSIRLDRDTLVRELSDLLTPYLTGGPGSFTEPPPDPFDVWA